MDRFTWKSPDGTYQIDDCMAVHKTLCYDENFKNPFDIYEGKAIDKLGRYEDAEEQGLLERFPVKIGDSMYVPSRNKVYPLRVVGFETYEGYKTMVLKYDSGEENMRYWSVRADISAIGVGYFRTEEEAKRALAERGKE